MWNIFKRPILGETLDSWTKILDDCVKVAFLTVPVVLYGQNGLAFKVMNALLLLSISYIMLFISNQLRKSKLVLMREN